MSELDDWAAGLAGTYVDVDGAYGNQCWDLSQSWLTRLCGATLWTQPSTYPGLAAGCWETVNSDAWPGPDMRTHLTPIPGDQPGQPGDIVIWQYGARLYPISHTAVLLQDNGANLYCLSQNSSPGQPGLPGYSPLTTGPAIYQSLPREGIAGFLRPVAISGMADTITPITEGFLMTLNDGQQQELLDKTRELWELIAGAKQGALADVFAEHNLDYPVDKNGGGKTSQRIEVSWAAKNAATIAGALLPIAQGIGALKTQPAAAAPVIDVPALAAQIAAALNTTQAHDFLVAFRNALPAQ